MFTKQNTLLSISLLCFLIINNLFLYKYGFVYFGNSAIPVFAYTTLFIVSVGIFNKFFTPPASERILKLSYIVISLLSILFVLFVKQIGEIGRLIAIKDWLDLYFAGSFPYYSFHTPSAFPVLFYLSIPFYYLGNIGLLEPLGIMLLLYLSYNSGTDSKTKFFHLMLLLFSVVFLYDFAVRSELLFNILLPVIVFHFAAKYLNPAKLNFKFFLFAVLFGLALSTRSVVAIVYAVMLTYLFKKNFVNYIIFGAVILTVFVLTLLPVYIWDSNGFIQKGPFAVQSFLAFIPMYVVALFILLSFLGGFIAKNVNTLYLINGLLLFAVVFISMLIKIFMFGIYEAMINDLFDLSYYSFAAPFLILAAGVYSIKEESNP